MLRIIDRFHGLLDRRLFQHISCSNEPVRPRSNFSLFCLPTPHALVSQVRIPIFIETDHNTTITCYSLSHLHHDRLVDNVHGKQRRVRYQQPPVDRALRVNHRYPPRRLVVRRCHHFLSSPTLTPISRLSLDLPRSGNTQIPAPIQGTKISSKETPRGCSGKYGFSGAVGVCCLNVYVQHGYGVRHWERSSVVVVIDRLNLFIYLNRVLNGLSTVYE